MQFYHGVAESHGVEVVEDLLTPHHLVVKLIVRHGGWKKGVTICDEDIENSHHLNKESKQFFFLIRGIGTEGNFQIKNNSYIGSLLNKTLCQKQTAVRKQIVFELS